MEMFNAFGFAERVLKEACWVSETTFWKPASDGSARIERGGWIQDTEEGLSEFPHVILNQARVHEFYLDVMRKSPSRLSPYYGRRLVDLAVDPAVASRGSAPEYPVSAAMGRAAPCAARSALN
jgi:phenol 2-monooxygenase (NADPH)